MSIKTGDPKTDSKVNNLLGAIQDKMKNRFVIEWQGSKIPRGAKLGGKEITWTQHGQVYTGGPGTGEVVGYYNRLAEFENGSTHRMEIFTDLDTCVDPSGKTIENSTDLT